jgi:hypothetical protein
MSRQEVSIDDYRFKSSMHYQNVRLWTRKELIGVGGHVMSEAQEGVRLF